MAWKIVTEARYWEMLGMLPPACHLGKGFLVGEPVRHDADGYPMFTPFLTVDGVHYEGDAPMTTHAFRALDARAAVAPRGWTYAETSTNRPGDMAAAYADETGVDYSTALARCNMD